ncbi:MAG: hypothetical protein HGA19_05980 [Oscillochloris sp.]|nr:hypothetical protein [Oscillochloris sp.]
MPLGYRRAAGRLVVDPPAVAFDSLEATFQSASQGENEYRRIGLNDDGQEPTIANSCRGGRHAWCVHQIRFRILMAEAALRDPLGLLSAFVEHTPDDVRRPRPYLWPTPKTALAASDRPGMLPKARLPESLMHQPVPRVMPPDPDLQREIDELFPD